jgi:phage/plasmid-associated DNA primase
MDIVGQWIEECCEPQANAETLMASLYRSYSEWAGDEIGWKLSVQKLGRALEDREFPLRRGSKGRRFRIGLRLKPSAHFKDAIVVPFPGSSATPIAEKAEPPRGGVPKAR